MTLLQRHLIHYHGHGGDCATPISENRTGISSVRSFESKFTTPPMKRNILSHNVRT